LAVKFEIQFGKEKILKNIYKKHITQLFPLNLFLNEANNMYLELSVTAGVPTSSCNLKILTLFTTHLFLLEVQKRMAVRLPLSLNPHTHSYPKAAKVYSSFHSFAFGRRRIGDQAFLVV
jgi:hypothetical protein